MEYGKNLPDVEKEIKSLKRKSNIIIVIGSEKIPSDLLYLSTINIAISNQPHSEVAALAVILVPVAPKGWPKAIAPPSILTFCGSIFKSLIHAKD